MIVQDIRTRVQRTFGDEANVQIDSSDIYRWISDAQREAVLQNEGLLEKTWTGNFTVNVNNYPLDPDLFVLHRVRVKTSAAGQYYYVPWLNGVDFERYVDGWDNSDESGTPYVFTEKDRELIFFPKPNFTLASGFKYEGSEYPTEVTSDGSALELPLYYHQYIVDYCLMQAYELDEDIAAHSAKGATVQATLDFNEGRENWFGRDKYPVVSDYEGDYY